MPTFTYTASSVSATIDAPDRATALRSLLARGVAPTAITEVRGGGSRRGSKAGTASGDGARGGMTAVELAAFDRELGTALSAGLPLVPALKTLARARRKPGQVRVLNHLLDKVEHGSTLADAMRSAGKPFDELVVNLVRAGEASGKLPEVLVQAADLQDKAVALRRAILGALVYPIILAFLVLVAVIVLVTFILPLVLKSIEGTGATLPLSTRMMMGLASVVSGYWWAILAGLIAGGWGLARLRASPGGRLWSDRLLITMPLVGPMLAEAQVARFTRTLGTLVQAGLGVLPALKLTGATVTNSAMRQAVERVAERVSAGRTIAEPLEESGYFPALLVQIVSLGERSGKLPELLSQAATAMEERTAARVRVFTEALKPILIMIVAGVVAFVIASILFAMLAVQDAIQ